MTGTFHFMSHLDNENSPVVSTVHPIVPLLSLYSIVIHMTMVIMQYIYT